jgi:hypothetical protein
MNRRRISTTLSSLALTGTLAAVANAASPGMFPFVIPWDDATPGTATDVSSLNARPAGVNGFITAKNGRFVESKTGKRVRFLGTNLAAHSAFPSHEDAEKVTARLAKYGINIVRLHHMDNDFWSADATIWDGAFKDHRHINPAQLDKLDYLIAQLKKNGIYANINLHVSRQFSEGDGFPASVDKIPTSFDKRVDYYDRRMIALQKEYAKQLLSHVNPYTHLTYAEDPAVAVVEINNENSLVGDPWANIGGDLDQMPEPFLGELVGFWNTWLAKKYGTDDKLKTAWLKGVTPVGPSLLSPASEWSIEHQGTSQAEMTVPAGAPADAAPYLHAVVKEIDGTDWHVQIHETGLDFKNGGTYTVSFRARADKPRAMAVGAALDQADWHNIGLSATADVTGDWKDFRYTFTAHDVVAAHGRVAFTLGNQTGWVDIQDFRVKPGAEGAGLQPGESLAKRNIGIPGSATKEQRADWLLFLVDQERSYTDEMRGYLKKDLKVHANIICSQISWGGMAGLIRESAMDFADNHAYWQHPSFPHKAWDSQDWNIPNTAMVTDLANGGGGTLRDLAEFRIAGKPYTVSEYNHPAPNDFQAETVPVAATFAAFQDWDILYLFDYGSYGTGGDNDKIGGFFGVGSNPAKWAFVPAAAMIFRQGAFAPASSATVISPGKSDWRTLFARGTVTSGAAWTAAGKSPDFLSRRLAIAETAANAGAKDGESAGASTLAATKTDAGARYVADSPGAVSIVGFVGGSHVLTKSADFQFPAFGDDSAPSARNFASVTLTPLDGKSLKESAHLLLTAVGRVENEGMVWNATRTSVTDRWGHGPSVAEGIPVTVVLPHSTLAHVYALDATGKRTQEVSVTHPVSGVVMSSFVAGPEYKTLWYEITE